MLFAALVLAIAAVGVYGVVAVSVSRRTQEVGVRVALGATRASIVRLVMIEALGLALALGLVGAGAGARAIRTMLFETTPADPLTYAGVAALLGATAVFQNQSDL